jgi:hypothetical protein
MDNNPDVGACQPKIKAFNRKTHFEHAGAAGGFIDYLGYPYCRGRVFNEVEQDNGQYDNIIDVFWASGACMVVRSALFFKVGALDDDFFAHMEEIDLCWRLNARGYRVVCVPQSTVYHVGGGTLNVESPRKTYLNFRNNLLMLYKNLPKKDLDKVLRIRKWLDYLAWLQHIFTGKKENAKAILKARKDFKLQILDCPPGTSCPVIAAVDGADFVVMVTEPTPFGLYDLKLAVDVIRKIGLPFGIVINRSGENDKLIEDWAKEEDINILTKIPDDRKIAECYSKGELVLRAMPEFKKYFEPLLNIVREAL